MAGLSVLVAISLVAAFLLLNPSGNPTPPLAFGDRAFDFPAFSLRVEDHAEGGYRTAFELEWQSRDDWTERYIRQDGSVGLETERVLGENVTLNGMGPAQTHSVGGHAVHVPGFWFRDVVATLPGPRETRIQNGSVITIRRQSPNDVQEWDGDSTTGIPLGYRQIVDGRVVREFRVVSLVLADGRVIR
jgi:hypothetical protein